MKMKDKLVRLLSSRAVIFLCRLTLGGLFIYASLDKIAHPAAFAKIIYNYRLFPDFSIYLSAVVVPWLEMISGLFLIAGIFSRASAAMLSTLLVIFTIAITINLARGLDFNCGCFSTTSAARSAPLWLVIRDILMLMPGLVIIFFHKKKTPVQSLSH